MTFTRRQLFLLIVSGSVLGLAGTDLVLPAIPRLPLALDGSIAQAQHVLAAFAAGTGCGLLLFGELGTKFNHRYLLIASLLSFAALSWLATLSTTIPHLVALRFFQGLSAAAPAVFAPGIIRALYDEQGTLRMIGLMGSIESMAPAIAPIIGAGLLLWFDWRASFWFTGVLALSMAGLWWLASRATLSVPVAHDSSSYWRLLMHPQYLRYAISQAFTVGGLLVFVFGAPTVIVISMGGSLSDFVIMQLLGITLFVISANANHRIVARFGVEPTIYAGSLLSAMGCLGLVVYAWAGGNEPKWLWLLFLPVNLGLGIRGPVGFYQAIVAAGADETRGSALLILVMLLAAALGTTLVAPVIEHGLLPLSLAASTLCISSVALLRLIKPLTPPST